MLSRGSEIRRKGNRLFGTTQDTPPRTRLEELVRALDLSVAELSRRSGVSERGLRGLQAGRNEPLLSTARKITLALGAARLETGSTRGGGPMIAASAQLASTDRSAAAVRDLAGFTVFHAPAGESIRVEWQVGDLLVAIDYDDRAPDHVVLVITGRAENAFTFDLDALGVCRREPVSLEAVERALAELGVVASA